MERDERTINEVIQFLLSHGYPEDSIVTEWNIRGRYYVDLAVIDPETKKPVALFEFKRERTTKSMGMALHQLKTYSSILGDETIPLYAVFGTDGEPPFEIYHFPKGLKRGEYHPARVSKVPDLSTLNIRRIRRNRDKIFNFFLAICWILAIIVTILLYFDFTGDIDISTQRLTLIGIIIALFLIPFASKLKILGFEFERFIEKRQN